MSARVAVALACVLLSACGVRAQDQPERLPPEVLPSQPPPTAASTTSPSTTPAVTTVPIYLVQEDRLVRAARPARRRAVEDALAALLLADEARGAQRSAVPPGTVVTGLSRRGDLLSVELSDHFGQVRGRDQLLAVAQLVWTATEFPPVRQVDVIVDGRRIELPVEQGEVSAQPGRREDYRSVSPAG